MPKLPTGELFKHKSKGNRMTKGTYVGVDGKRRPKVLWLAHDKDSALFKKATIGWFSWVAAGEGGWTPENIARMESTDTIALVRERFIAAERTRQMLTPHMPPAVVVQMPPAQLGTGATTHAATIPGTPMFHAAVDEFIKALEQQSGSSSH